MTNVDRDSSRTVDPRVLVHRLGDRRQLQRAFRGLAGGMTATELRRIGRLPDDVFDALVEGLGDPNPRIRWWCIQILDHVPDERAISAIAPLLDDPVDRVRRNAAHALGCLTCKPSADSSLPDHLLARLAELADSDPSLKVRREAATAYRCRLEALADT